MLKKAGNTKQEGRIVSMSWDITQRNMSILDWDKKTQMYCVAIMLIPQQFRALKTIHPCAELAGTVCLLASELMSLGVMTMHRMHFALAACSLYVGVLDLKF